MEITAQAIATTRAKVVRQVEAMACGLYDVSIVPTVQGRGGKPEVSQYYPHGLAMDCHINYLIKKNRQGCHIFIMPAASENRALILMDDLTADQIDKLYEQEYAPAVVTETSPGNFQAWLDLGPNEMSPEDRHAAAKILQRKFGGDMSSVGARHFGRLAGFTNCKPKHQDSATGRHPWVGLVSALPHVCKRAQELREEAAAVSAGIANARQVTTPRIPSGHVQASGSGSLGETFRRIYNNMIQRNQDRSRVDFAVCCALVRSGYTDDDIARGLVDGSPDLVARRGSNAAALWSYALHTAEEARRRIYAVECGPVLDLSPGI